MIKQRLTRNSIILGKVGLYIYHSSCIQSSHKQSFIFTCFVSHRLNEEDAKAKVWYDLKHPTPIRRNRPGESKRSRRARAEKKKVRLKMYWKAKRAHIRYREMRIGIEKASIPGLSCAALMMVVMRKMMPSTTGMVMKRPVSTKSQPLMNMPATWKPMNWLAYSSDQASRLKK